MGFLIVYEKFKHISWISPIEADICLVASWRIHFLLAIEMLFCKKCCKRPCICFHFSSQPHYMLLVFLLRIRNGSKDDISEASARGLSGKSVNATPCSWRTHSWNFPQWMKQKIILVIKNPFLLPLPWRRIWSLNSCLHVTVPTYKAVLTCWHSSLTKLLSSLENLPGAF